MVDAGPGGACQRSLTNLGEEDISSQVGYSIPIEGGRALTLLKPGEIIPEGSTLEPDAWDHEHCALCWKKMATLKRAITMEMIGCAQNVMINVTGVTHSDL